MTGATTSNCVRSKSCYRIKSTAVFAFFGNLKLDLGIGPFNPAYPFVFEETLFWAIDTLQASPPLGRLSKSTVG